MLVPASTVKLGYWANLRRDTSLLGRNLTQSRRGPPDVQRGAFCRSRPSVRGHRGVGWVTAAAAAIVLAATACAATPVAKAPRTPICPLTSRARPLVEKLTTEDDPVDLPRKRAWEASLGGKEAARPHVRARLAGWPAHAVVDPSALPSDERAFLERVAADTWRGLAALTDRENGLPVDHVRLAAPPTSGDGATDTTAGADVGDYTSISNVGLHLAAVVAAREIGLVGDADAVAAVTRVLDTLDRVETYQGFFFNYYDTTSLERSSNFLSFVDTSWLTTGLILARASFPALAARCSRLIERMHYGFFYDARRHQVSHGYYVHRRARSRYDYGVLYTEARLGVLLGIGKGEIPEDAWLDMVRTYPADCAGQTATPRGVRRRRVHGHTVVSGWYEWGGVRFVPSWGGSMFEALMPALVVDERRFAAQSLGANDVAHVLVQRRFATEELGYPVWGMSPSATPTGDGYGEYGVPVLGTRGYRPGAVTPHASALALLVDPEAAVANLRALAARFPVYGEYGFYDAVDPRTGAVARAYLALDQALFFLAVADHLKPHCVQDLFASDPIVRHALPLIGDERFFDD